MAQSAAGDDQHAAIAARLRSSEETREPGMRLRLRHAVQVDPGIDRIAAPVAVSARSRSRRSERRGYSFVTPGLDPGGAPFFARGWMAWSSPAVARHLTADFRCVPSPCHAPASGRRRRGALWQVLTTVPIGGVKLLPPFFFSTPTDVAARIVKWFVEGTICEASVGHAGRVRCSPS